MQPLNFQPIPYQGSKRRLAPRICKLFPQNIKTLYEPFAGSAAITMYAASHNLAQHFIIGDILPELVELWRLIIDQPQDASMRYRTLWQSQFVIGNDHFNIVRSDYNANKDPISLLYLIARCVKNAVRFNKNGAFTQSVDKRRTGVHPDKLERSIHTASKLLKGRSSLYCGDFTSCTNAAQTGDLVYMDPPYQGTTYGNDKRYAAQLEREHLEEALRNLNERNIPFILSYDGKTGKKVYAEPLQDDLCTTHLAIHAGRSSQSTLAGRAEYTVESLYVSKSLTNHLESIPDYSQPIMRQRQIELFAQQ